MKSITARLLISTAVVLLVFVLLTALAISWSVHRRAEQAQRDRLQGLVWGLLGATELVSDEHGRQRLSVQSLQIPEPRLNTHATGLYAELRGEDGEPIWRSQSTTLNAMDAPIELALGQWHFAHQGQGRNALYSAELAVAWTFEDGTEKPFRVRVASDGEALAGQLQQFDRTLLGSLLASAAGLLLLQLLALRLSLRPLHRIGDELEAIERGQRSTLDESLPSELAPLASGINALLGSERTRQAQYRQLLDDLAHTLKTPLAIINNLHTDDPDGVAQAQQQSHQMHAAVQRYLQRASTEAPRTLPPPVAVKPLLERLAAQLPRLFQDRPLQIEIRIPESLQLRVDEQDLFEILGNVLENACKYGATLIRVSAQSRTLLIDDNGPGFAAEMLESLTERGTRADTGDIDGQGLGLAVVRELMVAHGGQLGLGHSELGGAQVVLDFV